MNHQNGTPVSKRRRLNKWKVKGSRESHDCVNPVRSCDELYFTEAKELRDKSKEFIQLSIGDPARSSELPPHPAVSEAVKRVLDEGKFNGYANSSGLLEAKVALAKEYSRPGAEIDPKNVILTNAISGALEMSCAVLSNPGQNILLPSPAFGLYKCHAEARGVKIKLYSLLPDRDWEVDLEDMERLIDKDTAGIVVVNPSNPCGSVYSRDHIKGILAVAERHQVPIVADETYDGMVFTGKEFVAMASLSENVPILSCGGMSKKYMVPGWRLGWIFIHDRNDAFKDEITPGLGRLAMKLLGPCTLTQAALPDVFKNVPQEYHERNLKLFETNATICYGQLKDVPGIIPVMPAGAMYMMVTIDQARFPVFEDDVAFTKALLIEQSVFCLPGKAFLTSGCFRICLIMSGSVILTACQRIAEFCKNHYSEPHTNQTS